MAATRRGQPNWAKGLSAAVDSRIAKGVEKRRGKQRGPYRTKFDAATFINPETGTVELPANIAESYAYLLGLYLGDGSIVAKTSRLEISLDARYPDVVERCKRAMQAVHPRGKGAVRLRPSVMIVNSYGRHWLELFPQTGRGQKHLRPIVLAPWQSEVVAAQPLGFLHGLLESDGSRFDRVVGKRRYPAYEFTNRSEDIIKLFCQVAESLGLHYTRPSDEDVSIARRADVARLDLLLPMKSSQAA
jgi:hypothetical protein